MKAPNINTRKSASRAALMRQTLHSRINAADHATSEYAPRYTGAHTHNEITQLNADLVSEGTYREALTTYAVGYPGVDFGPDLEVLAPGVQVSERFTYKQYDNAEAFYSELTDDLRAPRGDFKEVEYTSEDVDARTHNRGLMVCVDRDQVKGMPDWEQRQIRRLLNRIRLNQLRRSINLLSAASTNTAKTWDTTAGKSPDGDVRTDLKTAHTAAGVRPNRIAYGPTAWSLRVSSYEAQDNAGGYAGVARTPKTLAEFLALEKVLVCEARYSTSSTAKSEALANLVLMYNAVSNAEPEDASNIKRFWSPCDNGQEIMVHRWDIGAKKMALAVEYNELLKITSTLGMRKFTVS